MCVNFPNQSVLDPSGELPGPPGTLSMLPGE